MEEAAQAEGREEGEADPFNLSDPGVASKLRRRNIKLLDVNRTVRRKLAKSLAEGFAAGESRQQIVERIKHQFNLAHRRAESIARTEIGAAVEEARHEGRLQAGVPLKSWLWSRKETGRPEHAATERATMAEPIPVEERFTIAGTDAACLHPRGTGRPEQDINCGCSTISRYPEDSLKAVLRRYAERGFLTYERMLERDAAPDAQREAA
ncbi:MAG: phage minor head protein [Planctomycetota bacterium]